VLVPAVVALAAACAPPTVTPPSGGTTSTAPAAPTTTTTMLPPIFTGNPVLYSTSALDSWGQDGIVYAVKIVGDTVLAVGDFANAVHHTVTSPRANVMAVRRSTGALLPFVANTNGIVYAVASDGASVYLGGDFTAVNGAAHARLAKVDLATGAVDPSFNASTGGAVRDLLLVGNRLYAVGEFQSMNGTRRDSGAVVDKLTGALDPSFDPGADGRINTVAINRTGTKLYLGGVFLHLGATARSYVSEVDPTTGKVQGPAFASVGDLIRDLTVKDDGTTVYGGGGGGFNSAAAWDATTGKRIWAVRADGDTQAIASSNGYVYMGFHDGFQGNKTLRLLALDPGTGAVSPSFMPISGSYPGVVALEADGRYLVAGGLFPRMGGTAVRGLAIIPA
jgi:hypothetical protein